MADALGKVNIRDVIHEVTKTHPKLQKRTREGMESVLKELSRGRSVEQALATAGVVYTTYRTWKSSYPPFKAEVDRIVKVNAEARAVADEVRRKVQARDAGDVFDPNRKTPPRPDLVEFRREYLGRPTPLHQRLVARALDDDTNLVTFILGPTGMGKDTIAGDFVLQQVAPDREGIRVAWFMENEDFSKRRLKRLARYLTDQTIYEHPPAKTPDGTRPARSCIEDWGPFKWERGMVHPDGTPVERPQWSSNAMYFLSSVAPEADPNLWATGIGGATYGARIDLAVLSDIFTVENQKSPTERKSQLAWIEGTLDTRLDESGRLVVIGTMLPDENNYEAMMDLYIGDARVVSEETEGPATYTRYANGVAVVMVKALYYNEEGELQSYWPERFPLEETLRTKDHGDLIVKDLSVEEIDRYAGLVGTRRIRGLMQRQKRSPRMFKAMFMQERDTESGGDFTDAILDLADDPLRTYGQAYPHEYIVVGADPARTGGAGWVAWAVDPKGETATVVDFFYGERLGTVGIRNRLVIEPVQKWSPVWFAYETNMEAAVLDDFLVQQAFKDFGVSVHKHRTGAERNDMRMGPGAMAAFMRSKQIRFPTQTAEDRERTAMLKAHFKAWEKKSISEGRGRPGRRGHEPDDLCMAAWIGWLKGWALLGERKRPVLSRMPVPESVRRRWTKTPMPKTGERINGSGATAYDLVEQFIGGDAT